MTDSHFITGIGVSQFYHGAQRLGLPAEKIMRRCGMNPDVALQPMEHTSVEDFERFLLALILESGDELFGLHVGEQIMPAIYGILPTLATMAGSTREAIDLAVRYQALVAGNAGSARLVGAQGENVALEIFLAYPNPVIRRHLVESMFALLLRMARFVFGVPDLRLESLRVEHAAPSPEARAALEAALGSPVTFSAGQNIFCFPNALLDVPMNTHGDDAMRMAEQLASKQLAQQQEHQGSIAQIKLQVRSLMASSSPRRDIVADRLGMSVRTLDRRLADAGLSWQQLVDSLRTQLAYELLRDSQLTIQEIAVRLGFADTRSFQRRFRHWSGKSPSEYRDGLVGD